jgi:hypothetical protein
LAHRTASPHLTVTTQQEKDTKQELFFFFSVHTREKIKRKAQQQHVTDSHIYALASQRVVIFFSLSLILLACSLTRFSLFLLLLLLLLCV